MQQIDDEHHFGCRRIHKLKNDSRQTYITSFVIQMISCASYHFLRIEIEIGSSIESLPMLLIVLVHYFCVYVHKNHEFKLHTSWKQGKKEEKKSLGSLINESLCIKNELILLFTGFDQPKFVCLCSNKKKTRQKLATYIFLSVSLSTDIHCLV